MTRKYARSVRLPDGDLAGQAKRATTKSSVSRRFVALSTAKLKEWQRAYGLLIGYPIDTPAGAARRKPRNDGGFPTSGTCSNRPYSTEVAFQHLKERAQMVLVIAPSSHRTVVKWLTHLPATCGLYNSLRLTEV